MIDINSIMTEILRLLPFFIPIIIIQYGLMIFALVQLFRNEAAYLPKWGWALIIIFFGISSFPFGIIAPVVYLIVGKKKEIEND